MAGHPGKSRKYPETAYGKAVMYYRMRLELTQGEFAAALGLPKNRISAIESGETQKPRRDTVRAIIIGINSLGLKLEIDEFERKVSGYQSEIDAKDDKINNTGKIEISIPEFISHDKLVCSTESFMGRDQELDAIEKALQINGDIADIRAVVVYGLGGVGKTTLAREYAVLFKDRYSGVWWLNAEHTESLDDGLIELGAQFNSNIAAKKDKQQAAKTVFTYLNHHSEKTGKPWLLIYDNIEDQEVFNQRNPRSGVHILLTSRARGWSAFFTSVPIVSWSSDVACTYIDRASGRADLDKAEVRKLVHTLGGLPLAISHAAAFLQRNITFSPASYLLKLNEWLHKVPKNAEYPDNVFATFHQAIDVCNEERNGVNAVLSLASVFGPDNIPFEVFRQSKAYYPKELQEIIENEETFLSILGVLHRHSLIHLNMHQKHFSMHRLVQRVIQDGLGERKKQWLDAGIKLLIELCPESGYPNWSRFERILLHAKTVIDVAGDTDSPELAVLACNIATYLYERGGFAEIEPYYLKALAIKTKNLGEQHSEVADILNSIGILYDYQRRYREAETVYCKALAIREAIFGKEHPHVAATLNNLALNYIQLRRFKEAEDLFLKAKAIREKAYGADHPRVAQCLSNLALLYKEKKEYGKAEIHFQDALSIRQQALGKEHPQVALVMHHMGVLYMELERLLEAEDFFMKALSIRKKALGDDHPFVATTLSYLARLAFQNDRKREAIDQYQTALCIYESCLPEDHPRLIETREDLEKCLNSPDSDVASGL